MTPSERDFWLKVQRRAGSMQPDIARALLRSFQNLRDGLSERQMSELIATRQLDTLLNEVFGHDAQNIAFTPLRAALQRAVTQQATIGARDVIAALPKTDAKALLSFDFLNPRVITAVRTLDTKVITTLQGDVRAAVRGFTESGLQRGIGPQPLARQIRDVVGLAPSQEQYVRNLRAELEAGQYGAATRRVLLDRRFNLAKIDALSATERTKRIDTIVGAYRKSYVAFNAETNARTASLDSTKLGQRLSWEDAIAKGIIDRDRLEKTWRGVKDDRERPEHLAMEGETVPFDQPFSNGEMTPGDDDFNCRCVPIVRVV